MDADPPGPKGLPVVGNTYRYSRDPFAFLTACGEAYGDVVALSLGRRRTYMLTDPADIERVLVTDADQYGKATFGDDALDDLLGDGLLLSEGRVWREARDLWRPAFASDRLAGLDRTITDHAVELADRLSDGDVVDLEQEMARLTVRIIADAMFDTRLDAGQLRTIQRALEPLGRRFEPDIRRFLIPEWVPTEENRTFREAIDALDAVLWELVDRREGDHETGTDLLSILLGARDEGRIDDEALRDELVTMLLAGHDTTALALTYTWYLLDRNPEAERRLHEEVDAVDGVPETADARSFTFVGHAIDESMRLYPPVYALFREPMTDAEFDGYTIPAGSALMLPQWVVHRSPDHYENPREFDPDRWRPERSRERHSFAFFPFGGGPRACIGRGFSLLEAKLILGTLAREYRFDVQRDEPPELRGSLTMHPRDGMEAVVRER